MTIILFLIDTSASMNQRTYLGTSFLDVAKGAVELFMKFRSRDQASRWDRYMLLTFEDPPANIKAGWKESHATFMNELKNLTATGLTPMGPSLKHAFDLLNINRMQSGIDTYGQGRCPFYLEPAVIIFITDGQRLTGMNGVHTELNLPMHTPVPGSELTKEPFRWDQRLFGVVLKLPGTQPYEQCQTFIPSAEDSPLDMMCEVTGGRSYAVSSQRQLLQCLESLLQKAKPGVVINFEKYGPDPVDNLELNGNSKENQDTNSQDVQNGLLTTIPNEDKARPVTPIPNQNNSNSNTAWHCCRRLLYVQRSAQNKGYAIGHWPIPESFWPDPNSPNLPARSAQPVVKFCCTPCEPMVIENMPFDKYELEPSPLTQYILERRQSSICWQVFLPNSAKYSELGSPFGYLKASTNLQSVNLFVMPYNYPVLLPLLDELFKVHKIKPPPTWRQRFDNYLKTMPAYYAQMLRRALARMGTPSLVPDNLDNNLSYSVISYLKKLKNQAKVEYERLVSSVGQKTINAEGIKVQSRTKTSILKRKDFHTLLANVGGDMSLLKQEVNEFTSFTIGVPDKEVKPQYYRNPFDIPRKMLLDQLARMRANLLQTSTLGAKLIDEDQLHSVPVQQMGNYQEYLKKQSSPLREIEPAAVRQHLFGNPFKVNKNLMIDEADEAMPGQSTRSRRSPSQDSSPGSHGPKRRKPGPLPRDTPIRRPSQSSAGSISGDSDVESLPGSPKPGTNDDDVLIIEPENVTNNHNHNHEEDEDNNGALEEVDDLVIDEDSGINSDVDQIDEDNVKHVDVKKVNPKKLWLIHEHNMNVKRRVCKQIRKPGRCYDALFKEMSAMRGNVEVKVSFIREMAFEAARFKKKLLVEMIEQYERSFVRLDTKKKLKDRTMNSSAQSLLPVNTTQVVPAR
ncbi:integrator complex subunit 6-like [Lineus longissimus]|uniref:integrator complex subunit 6-like n=1 Tax=Lineus longissimus TaxID=88925 RepID=UPI002B4C6235